MLERLPLFAGTGGRRGFAGMPTLGTAARPWELAAPVEGFSATWSCAERSAADAPRAHIRKKAAEGTGRGPLATKTQYSTTSARVVNERIVPAFSAGPQSADTAALWGFGGAAAFLDTLPRSHWSGQGILDNYLRIFMEWSRYFGQLFKNLQAASRSKSQGAL